MTNRITPVTSEMLGNGDRKSPIPGRLDDIHEILMSNITSGDRKIRTSPLLDSKKIPTDILLAYENYFDTFSQKIDGGVIDDSNPENIAELSEKFKVLLDTIDYFIASNSREKMSFADMDQTSAFIYQLIHTSRYILKASTSTEDLFFDIIKTLIPLDKSDFSNKNLLQKYIVTLLKSDHKNRVRANGQGNGKSNGKSSGNGTSKEITPEVAAYVQVIKGGESLRSARPLSFADETDSELTMALLEASNENTQVLLGQGDVTESGTDSSGVRPLPMQSAEAASSATFDQLISDKPARRRTLMDSGFLSGLQPVETGTKSSVPVLHHTAFSKTDPSFLGLLDARPELAVSDPTDVEVQVAIEELRQASQSSLVDTTIPDTNRNWPEQAEIDKTALGADDAVDSDIMKDIASVRSTSLARYREEHGDTPVPSTPGRRVPETIVFGETASTPKPKAPEAQDDEVAQSIRALLSMEISDQAPSLVAPEIEVGPSPSVIPPAAVMPVAQTITTEKPAAQTTAPFAFPLFPANNDHTAAPESEQPESIIPDSIPAKPDFMTRFRSGLRSFNTSLHASVRNTDKKISKFFTFRTKVKVATKIEQPAPAETLEEKIQFKKPFFAGLMSSPLFRKTAGALAIAGAVGAGYTSFNSVKKTDTISLTDQNSKSDSENYVSKTATKATAAAVNSNSPFIADSPSVDFPSIDSTSKTSAGSLNQAAETQNSGPVNYKVDSFHPAFNNYIHRLGQATGIINMIRNHASRVNIPLITDAQKQAQYRAEGKLFLTGNESEQMQRAIVMKGFLQLAKAENYSNVAMRDYINIHTRNLSQFMQSGEWKDGQQETQFLFDAFQKPVKLETPKGVIGYAPELNEEVNPIMKKMSAAPTYYHYYKKTLARLHQEPVSKYSDYQSIATTTCSALTEDFKKVKDDGVRGGLMKVHRWWCGVNGEKTTRKHALSEALRSVVAVYTDGHVENLAELSRRLREEREAREEVK